MTAAIEQAGRRDHPDERAGEGRAVAEAIAAGGARALEVTMTVPRAVELIAELAPTMPSGFLLGAGTVVDAATAKRVIDAGAQFVVGPVFRREVITACHERDARAARLFHAD